MFYNFLLQERAPRIKSTVFTPEMERHEYRKSCNKTKIKAKPNKLKVPEDTEVYKEPEKITVHPVTRCQIRKIDGKDVVVDRKSEDCNPEKKNPILYSGRLNYSTWSTWASKSRITTSDSMNNHPSRRNTAR